LTAIKVASYATFISKSSRAAGRDRHRRRAGEMEGPMRG
jgi:hypothetical protein